MDNNKSKNGALPVGTTLRSPENEYKIEAILGIGGFGITYKVSSEQMVQVGNVTQCATLHFAIKEFFMHGCDRSNNGTTVTFASTLEGDVKQSLQDFITEAKRLNVLGTKSRNIVKVNEVFEANATAYYVMEYLDGGSLESYVNQHGALPWYKVKNIPIANAVSLLHEEKLLHMDIKPDNIMLKHNANRGITPVLIDFGIAKHFDSKGRPTSHLMAKGASDGYAPMEQYTGIDTFAPEIDVYALGATMLFMLTGKQPPKAFDIRSSRNIEELLPNSIDEQAKTTISRAMCPSRFERTPTIEALLDAISIEQDTQQKINPIGIIDEAKEYCSDVSNDDAYDIDEEENDIPVWKKPILWGVIVLFAVVVLFFAYYKSDSKESVDVETNVDDTGWTVDSVAEEIGIDDVQETTSDNINQEEDGQSKTENTTDGSTASDGKVYDVVEQMPQYPGGESALISYLSENIKYPVVAEENGTQGRVIVSFIVELDGSISTVKVVKSVDVNLDKEAVRVVRNMKKWIPGKQNGAVVRVKNIQYQLHLS